ncbi:hypothetical protein [uncultured Chryseobacterium sp.]|uniref:hypothetical protein n=1 Tax=uncultured Chryseobacterium sp. TaxID=259322 RepID=UPI0025ECF83F|nr:hypothetical protein [uncultured Chryseobacterium sp.]
MILIISADGDVMSNNICIHLSRLNKDFIRLNESQLITDVNFDFGQDRFEFVINGDSSYNLKEINSVYYRNGSIFYQDFSINIDTDVHQFYQSEYRAVTKFIYYYLNKNCSRIFGNLLHSEINKLEVLDLAKDLGFKIPETHIVSHKQLLDRILNSNSQFITKSISEMKPIYLNNELFLNYTKAISCDDINEKPENIIPSLIQERINSEYEIRIFFFQQNIWSIAVFDLLKNADGRNVNGKKYIPYELPDGICAKILLLAKNLSLNCGTIDILRQNGEFYFLEVNPLGQFHDVNYWGNYKIDQHIAELL